MAFGTAYLTKEDFRASAPMFGVGMAFIDYPNSTDGNNRLDLVLQNASRMIDAFCLKDFTPGARTEQAVFDSRTLQFHVNNPPVSSVSSCRLRYASDGELTVQPTSLVINNQRGYIEISRLPGGNLDIFLQTIGLRLIEPFIEINYISFTDVPAHVKLACGYQTAHLINQGFTDASLPPQIGLLDMKTFKIHNRKAALESEPDKPSGLCADAQHLLRQEIRFSAA